MRVDLYLKVQLDVGEGEQPRKLAEEICRQILKNYAVRTAELSNIIVSD